MYKLLIVISVEKIGAFAVTSTIADFATSIAARTAAEILINRSGQHSTYYVVTPLWYEGE